MTEETTRTTNLWVQLRLKHPALGERHRERFMAYEGASQEALHAILYRDPHEARVVCECRGLLHAELTLAAQQGVHSLAGLLRKANVSLVQSDCARCLTPLALSLAAATGESPRALRDEAASLALGHGPESARITQAYASLGDDPVRESSEPELIYSVSSEPE